MALRFPASSSFLAALLVFTGIPSFAEFYTDWLWFEELGYEQVFLKSLSAQATTGLAVGAVVFAILWLNLGSRFACSGAASSRSRRLMARASSRSIPAAPLAHLRRASSPRC